MSNFYCHPGRAGGTPLGFRDLSTISELQSRLGDKFFTPDFFRSLPLFAERNCSAVKGQIRFVQ